MLSLWVGKSQLYWDQHLALLTMAYRSAEHESMKETPNTMILGGEITMPIDLLVGSRTPQAPVPTNRYVMTLQNKLHMAHEVAREITGRQMLAQKRHYDRNVKQVLYDVGSVVWLHKNAG